MAEKSDGCLPVIPIKLIRVSFHCCCEEEEQKGLFEGGFGRF